MSTSFAKANRRSGSNSDALRILLVCGTVSCFLASSCADPGADYMQSDSQARTYPPVEYRWDIPAPLEGELNEVAKFAMETVVLEKGMRDKPELAEQYKSRVDYGRFTATEKELEETRNLWEAGGVMLRAVAVNPITPPSQQFLQEWEVLICSYNTPGLYLYSDEDRENLVPDPSPSYWYRPRVVRSPTSGGEPRIAGTHNFLLTNVGHTYYTGGVNGPNTFDGERPPCEDFAPSRLIQEPPAPLPPGG
ncbi:hypothetical protein [Nocardia fusca]|uniref:hypothetical protein n=1 Tax=Nocardia fusca TaxID=941183 RepID=UPI000A5EB423|nr:hypothetical protein [Nocardia fusca]